MTPQPPSPLSNRSRRTAHTKGSIALHYNLTVPPEDREATGRALRVHPEGCPAHQSVKGAITVTWDAQVHVGDQVIKLSSEEGVE